ncbi:hypothetical protein Tco_0664881, partial [Tanacetum coccineum]
EHRECYDGLIKSYDLDKSLFSTYDKVYSLKRSRDKDKDEDLSAGSDRGLKKRKTSKDVEPTKEEPEFEVADFDMPQDQKENLGNDDEEPKGKVASKRDCWLMTFASSANKPSKTFDELMSTPIDFSAYIMNGLKITNLTQETLLGLAFKLLKGTRTNYAELEYDFEECYKALSKKLDWDNPEGGDYPFDLNKHLFLVMNRNRQMVPVDYFFNNDLKYLQGGILTMTYTTSTFYGYARGMESTHDVYSTKRILAVTRVKVMRKHRYGYLREIEIRRADNDLYTFKEGDFPRLPLRMFTRSMVIQKRVEDLQLGVKSYQKKINVTKSKNIRPSLRKKDSYTPYQDPQEFIYVDNQGRNMLMRSDELYKFSDGTLIRLRTSLDDNFTKNVRMEYLPQRRWSSLENKRAHIMIKAIDKQLKERKMTRSFKRFVGGRHYETNLRLHQRKI